MLEEVSQQRTPRIRRAGLAFPHPDESPPGLLPWILSAPRLERKFAPPTAPLKPTLILPGRGADALLPGQ